MAQHKICGGGTLKHRSCPPRPLKVACPSLLAPPPLTDLLLLQLARLTRLSEPEIIADAHLASQPAVVRPARRLADTPAPDPSPPSPSPSLVLLQRLVLLE